jgi:hypothetical protein
VTNHFSLTILPSHFFFVVIDVPFELLCRLHNDKKKVKLRASAFLLHRIKEIALNQGVLA